MQRSFYLPCYFLKSPTIPVSVLLCCETCWRNSFFYDLEWFLLSFQLCWHLFFLSSSFLLFAVPLASQAETFWSPMWQHWVCMFANLQEGLQFIVYVICKSLFMLYTCNFFRLVYLVKKMIVVALLEWLAISVLNFPTAVPL